MKKIDISTKKYPNTFVLVDDEDYDKLNQWKWHCNIGYAYRSIWGNKRRGQSMHRLIMGNPKGLFVDHINRNKLDNRKSNLRICSSKESVYNTSCYKKNKTGYKGVCIFYCQSIHKGKKYKYKYWRSRITFEGKEISLGLFKTPEEAAIAYNEKAKELQGEFACLNEV